MAVQLGEEMTIEFEIVGLPMTTNSGGRLHWAVKTKEAKKWRLAVVQAISDMRLNEQDCAALPFKTATLHLTRHSARECDFDGLVSSFKNVVDSLIYAGVIVDDKMSVIGQPKYCWTYAKQRQGKITVKVESV